MTKRHVHIAVLLTSSVCTLLALMSCGGGDPVEPKPLPRISNFSAQPLDIMPGDSSLLDYSTSGADSSKIFPDGSRLSPTSSGEKWVEPSVPTTYWLVGYNSTGRDSATLRITMDGAVAEISEFSLSPTVVLIGDSTKLTWQTQRADDLVVDNGIGRPMPVDSGGLWLWLSNSATYRAIAINSIGRDTAEASVTVENPTVVVADGGAYHKGTLGSSTLIPPLEFRVEDARGGVLTLPWIHLALTDGDGALTPDSLQGIGSASYTFSGSQTSAVVQALVRDVDTTEVHLRTNAIVPGVGGQGQYVLFGDPYAAVLALNGNPVKVDEHPDYWLLFADYEDILGVVFYIADDNQSHTADPTDPVIGVIFTANFTGAKTADSIGIGSAITDIRAVYGTADTTYLDTVAPVAQAFIYRDEGLTFFTTVSGDSSVVEMHVIEPSGKKSPTAAAGLGEGSKVAPNSAALRRFSR